VLTQSPERSPMATQTQPKTASLGGYIYD